LIRNNYDNEQYVSETLNCIDSCHSGTGSGSSTGSSRNPVLCL